MKDGFGDILYLLAMVAFFVFSAVMKSRKAKKKLLSQPEPVSQDSYGHEREDALEDFDDFFNTTENNIGAVKEEEKRVEKVFVTEPPTRRFDSIYKTRIDRKIEPAFSSDYDIHETVSFWDEEEFDLKKAVIFSEILKRPEL